MTLQELQLPSIASLRAIAALRSPHLSLVRPARIGLGFESAGPNQKTLAEIEDLLGGPGRLTLPYSLRWLLDAMTGLGVLHRGIGFVHGEVQPEHLVLGEDGVGRLIPVVRPHWVRGEQRSPSRLYYLPPEKLLGDAVDVRGDVFSVGVLLWEALAGQRLFETTSVDDIIARLMGGGIPLAQAPEGESWTVPLAHVAERAISVDPARRFSSIAEMKGALETLCLRYLASTPGMAEVFGDPQRRARIAVRDPILPDSQRVTVPPADVDDEILEAAADRLSRSSLSSIELEEGVPAAPVPARVATPAWDPRGTPSNASPNVPHVASAVPHVASAVPRDASLVPRDASLVPRDASLVPRDASLAPRGASLAPLVATRPALATLGEPEFELRQPRKGRLMIWLLLGAGVAVAGLALRPWLAQELAAQRGSPAAAEQAPQAASPAPDPMPRSASPASSTSASTSASSSAASSSAPAVGIASTPASPDDALGTRPRPPARQRAEERSPPRNNPPRSAPETAPKDAQPSEPLPSPPKPVPSPKSVPVSEGERYGI